MKRGIKAMTAGLPGIGIGGIFYLLCAVLMPVKELYNTVRGRTSRQRWGMVAKQFGLLCGIMIGFWLTGLLLGMTLHKLSPITAAARNNPRLYNVFRLQPMYVSFLMLGIVLWAVQLVNAVVDRHIISKIFRKK